MKRKPIQVPCGLPEGVRYMVVEEFPGYLVGDDGSVWTCRHVGTRCATIWTRLATGFDQDGYRRVGLKSGKGVAQRHVHRLVLAAFVGSRPPGKESRHIDGNKLNNRLSNLQWGTQRDNAQDRVKHGTCPLLRKGIAHPQGRLTDEQVAAIVTRARKGESRSLLASEFKITPNYVSQLKAFGGRDPRRRVRAKEALNG